MAPYMERLYRALFALSREYQQSLLARTGLIGHPLGHSCSPQLHGLYGDTGYQLWDITPDELPDFMQRRDFALANVTIPYKQAVLPDCDTLSDTARRIGSVNTLICRDGRVHGDNTDAYRLCRPGTAHGRGFFAGQNADSGQRRHIAHGALCGGKRGRRGGDHLPHGRKQLSEFKQAHRRALDRQRHAGRHVSNIWTGCFRPIFRIFPPCSGVLDAGVQSPAHAADSAGAGIKKYPPWAGCICSARRLHKRASC